MRVNLVLLRSGFLLLIASLFFLYKQLPDATVPSAAAPVKISPHHLKKGLEREDPEEEARERAKYTEARIRHEFEMLRNPFTKSIPTNIRTIERFAASRIPAKFRLRDAQVSGMAGIYGTAGITTPNDYQSIGPENIAGRSRTLAFDRRNVNIMLTGGPTGGIFRSTNGGASWTFVTPENDIRSTTSIVQDPTQPDTWYCGTGEAYFPISFQDVSNGTVGDGIFKSTDNGASWLKLAATDGDQNAFGDSPFDLVHRLAVNPVNGYVYAAVHRRIMRSKDRGQSWEQVLGNNVTASIAAGITEVAMAPDGSKVFAAFSGGYTDRAVAGVWESATGNSGGWKRIAGGGKGAADSVAGWRGYGLLSDASRTQGRWDRIVLTPNSTSTRLFVLYKNDQLSEEGNPEADLFRCDISSGNASTYTWTNLNAYVPDEPDFDEPNLDPYSTYFNGFAMSLAVKPDNDNILFIGGTMIHRVDLTKTDAAQKFRRIGGYGRGFLPGVINEYTNHHPDVHGIYFAPGNNTTLYTASDGGVHRTANPMAATVQWTPLVRGLQTVQYQTINISTEPEFSTISGGTQDNGTITTDDPYSNITANGPNGTDQFQLLSGDGASSAVSSFTKSGNTWKQNYFASTVNGTIYRFAFTFTYNGGPPATLMPTNSTYDDITPSSLNGQGQWLTLLVNDPDSTEHLYYNSKNELYRTLKASAVTATGWTQLTGVGNTVSSDDDLTFMAISKKINGNKYLYFGTDNGHIYRLNNPNTAAANASPVNITPPAMVRQTYVAGIAVNPRNPDTVLAVVSNYDSGGETISNIYWTGNATAASPTWQVLDGALGPVSSQSCEIVVKTTGVEYYVGTSIGLYSTTAINGGSTQWLHEGTGILKTAIVRALKNRQQDNVMAVGTHGNGAFITNIGSPVVIGDVATGIPDPITNDKQFIKDVFPTVSPNAVQYRIGNLFTIKTIMVQVYNLKGQLVYQQRRSYQNGTIDLTGLAWGQYILTIYSDDKKYRHVQKLIRS